MENQIYRVGLTDKAFAEIYVCHTNELNPYKEIRELAMVVINGETQLDASFAIEEIDSLIKYLEDCKSYIKDFNSKSKPREPEL